MLGLTLAIVAGIMCGAFAMPMRYLGRWSWENVWDIFILVSCVLMPIIITTAMVHDVVRVLQQVPARAVTFAVLTGFAWGF